MKKGPVSHSNSALQELMFQSAYRNNKMNSKGGTVYNNVYNNNNKIMVGGQDSSAKLIEEIEREYENSLNKIDSYLSDDKAYTSFLLQCVQHLDEEFKTDGTATNATSSYTNSLKSAIPLCMDKDWLDIRDHQPENSILVKHGKDLNPYILHILFKMAGTVHKMWYGYKNPAKYQINATPEEQKNDSIMQDIMLENSNGGRNWVRYNQGKIQSKIRKNEQVCTVIEFIEPQSVELAIQCFNGLRTLKGKFIYVTSLVSFLKSKKQTGNINKQQQVNSSQDDQQMMAVTEQDGADHLTGNQAENSQKLSQITGDYMYLSIAGFEHTPITRMLIHEILQFKIDMMQRMFIEGDTVIVEIPIAQKETVENMFGGGLNSSSSGRKSNQSFLRGSGINDNALELMNGDIVTFELLRNFNPDQHIDTYKTNSTSATSVGNRYGNRVHHLGK